MSKYSETPAGISERQATHAAEALQTLQGIAMQPSNVLALAQAHATLALWAEMKRGNDRAEREDAIEERARRASI